VKRGLVFRLSALVAITASLGIAFVIGFFVLAGRKATLLRSQIEAQSLASTVGSESATTCSLSPARATASASRSPCASSSSAACAYLLGLWGLPHLIMEAVAHHHSTEGGSQRLDTLNCVRIAGHLVDEVLPAPGEARPGPLPLDAELLQQLGVPAAFDLATWRGRTAKLLTREA
jgi:hypothetical protein